MKGNGKVVRDFSASFSRSLNMRRWSAGGRREDGGRTAGGRREVGGFAASRVRRVRYEGPSASARSLTLSLSLSLSLCVCVCVCVCWRGGERLLRHSYRMARLAPLFPATSLFDSLVHNTMDAQNLLR
jgi:hypothetical protein